MFELIVVALITPTTTICMQNSAYNILGQIYLELFAQNN